MQKVLPDPINEAVQNAANELQGIDLRKVRGEQRDRIKAAREAVSEAQKSLAIQARNDSLRGKPFLSARD